MPPRSANASVNPCLRSMPLTDGRARAGPATDDDRARLVLLELLDAVGELRLGDVLGVGDVTGGIITGVAHVEHQRVAAVDELHRLESTHLVRLPERPRNERPQQHHARRHRQPEQQHVERAFLEKKQERLQPESSCIRARHLTYCRTRLSAKFEVANSSRGRQLSGIAAREAFEFRDDCRALFGIHAQRPLKLLARGFALFPPAPAATPGDRPRRQPAQSAWRAW